MVPRTILRQLARLRRRERGLALLWGTARALAVAVTVLALACLADWTIDRWQDTPWALRYALLAGQVALWTGLVVAFLFRPLLRRLSDTWLSLYVEEREPQLQHRLVSAVQLNQPGADTEGMSPEMIAAVTRQAEEQAGRLSFASLADHRRLRWSVALVAPVALAVGLPLLLWPNTVLTLLARQFLADQDIPRSLLLESEQAERVCPAGEEVVLRFHVRGDLAGEPRGEVRIAPDGQPVERYPLELESSSPGAAVFLARIPPTTADFAYHARLEDARTRRPGHVHFEAAPAIIELRAWAQLPDFCGRRPDGKPYEREQPSGDLALLPGSAARVAIHTQKPVQHAFLEILPPTQSEPGQARIEQVLRRIDLAIAEDGQQAEGSFTPRTGEASYRVVVTDAYGFHNVDAPRRSIRLLPDELPRVALLPELFPSSDGQGNAEDFEVSGIPVPLGGSIRIAYTCSSPYGLGRPDQQRTPRLCYRINDGSWWRLPLNEVAASNKSGPFDPRYGAFENSRFMDQVEYHAVPSADPSKTPGRLEGGGRFDLQTRRIPGLKVGDRLELCLEVYDQNPRQEPARSESRIKTVVTLPEVETWVRETLQEESRIRQLEGKQEGIFAAAGTPDEEPAPVTGRVDTASADISPPSDKVLPLTTPFVRDWQLIGPFASPTGSSHDRVWAVETEKTDLGRDYDGVGGKVRWKIHHGQSDRIELDRIFNYVYSGAAYAVCWVHSDRPRRLQLATGSDDGIKVWINRRLVLDRKADRPANPGDDRELFDLKAGWSEVLVKVDNTGGMWAFFFELRDPRTNQMAQGLKVSLTPPGPPPHSFVRQWQIIGPFPNVNDEGHQKAFGPETDDASLARAYDGIKAKVRWQRHQSESDKIDLQQLLDHGEAGVAYALCWVRSPKRKALLATGSDDGIKVWVNRRVVLDRPVHREAIPGEDQTPIALDQAWNEVLVKVDNRFGTWAFFLELREEDGGRPLADVEVRTTPPGDDALRFVRHWQLLGPFPNPDNSGHGRAYPPETEKVNLGKDYDGIGGKVRWRGYYSPKDVVELGTFYNRPFHESNVAYAVCWVRTEKARPVTVATGSDDGIKVWINRKLVTDKALFRELEPGEDSERAELAAGWNEVLVKVDNRFGRWGFALELRHPDTGRPLPDLQYRITPPGQEVAVRPPPNTPPRGLPVNGYLRRWQTLGPLPTPPEGGYDKVYDAEKEKVDLGKEYAGIPGKVRWKLHESKEDRIDLRQLYNHREQGVAYAVCWIHNDRPRPAEFLIGSDDGMKLWLNRQLVWGRNEQRGALPGQDRALFQLKPGWQEVLVKVDNRGGNEWAFYLSLIDPKTRKSIPGLKVSTTPP